MILAYEIQLVCLFRCKICGVRVFEHDIQRHLGTHGIYANGESRKYFSRGPRDTPEKPGYHHKSLYQGHSKRRTTPAPKA